MSDSVIAAVNLAIYFVQVIADKIPDTPFIFLIALAIVMIIINNIFLLFNYQKSN